MVNIGFTFLGDTVNDILRTFLVPGGTVAVVLLAVIAALAALIYFRNPGRRTCFRSWASICSFRRGDGRVQYCRVDTTEEARLLLDASDPTQCQTDSDDDLLHA
ncbi:hypothetical protein X777_09068 [Ooceraea biroi]|uniref:Uncharacterized protein n=1 Tax=Ooceraea biroi TaxID=2015173 RepID=A0A026W7H1_OOCBI|nr:hypothetical protein X777_09068 [Ooceraea biroi]